jgi:hypothetical protein
MATVSRDIILEAIQSFAFSGFGCDEMDDLVSDESLDIGPALADHIYGYLTELAGE